MEGIATKLDHKQIWSECLNYIRTSIPGNDFHTWFEPIVPLKLENKVLTIQVPTYYFYEFIEEQYIKLVGRALRDVIGAGAKLEYSVVMDRKQSPSASSSYTVNYPTAERHDLRNRAVDKKYNKQETPNIRNPFIIPGVKKLDIDPQLNPEYTFDNFIEGDCNRLARSASEAVAKNPGKTAFNPLFLYGKSGLGKTHLGQAIGIEVKKEYPEKTVLYVSANKFTTQYTDSVARNSANDFMHFYQMIDVLIIDDIQELAGKEGTQNTFFHIFNHLHQSGKQLILTSDKPPVALKGMKERLLSRFKWGLPADLQSPDFETRVEILKNKIYKDGIIVSDEIVRYIASHITDNVRELEGALISLLAMSTLNKAEITFDIAKSVVDRLVSQPHREITVDQIQQKVCEFYGLDINVLQSKTRKREIVQARQVAMFFSKNLTNSSLSAIGAVIGRRDHATVLHACKAVKNLQETNTEFKHQLKEIESMIRQ
ncbi:chromosomal replication initiator protein DnaA [Marinilabilia rubra]|uniref:Chromosomal replication initiator protein DnaA n=1 Tax=Marinilabilia rubra TaxID=2162893 RepID=A0A2U2BA84_9BACT|nr:chromosomal replication initiator protein DnaA [Marinilabilia rubra]PWD99978.1 chromosomal replication initiator protein DnaA [Marinilabilia rubra]